VQREDDCDKIAIDFDVSIDDLKKFNDKKTWGWSGCGTSLRFDTVICVSEGDPPMPERVAGATCGPQADKNTPRPPKGNGSGRPQSMSTQRVSTYAFGGRTFHYGHNANLAQVLFSVGVGCPTQRVNPADLDC